MTLDQVRDETELLDGRVYLCGRLSRHGNAIWETLEAQKHLLLHQGLKLPMKSFARIYHLPKQITSSAD